VKTIKELCSSGNGWNSNFTLIHIIDIFKGSTNQKIKAHSEFLNIFNYKVKKNTFFIL